MTEAEAAATANAERPMLVFVYPAPKDGELHPRFLVEQDEAFRADKVAVGARFFDCLRISATDAAKDRVLKEAAEDAPCVVFVRPNYEVAKVVKKTSERSLFRAMCKTMKLDYETCVATAYKKQERLLKEERELDKERVELIEIEQDLSETESKGKIKRLERKRDKLEAKINEKQAEIDEASAKLYELAPKST